MEIREITVGELRRIYHANEYDIEIDTPDGWQGITKWYDKGDLPCVRIETEKGFVTTCATNHLIEAASPDGDRLWILAGELSVGSRVIVDDGSPTEDTVISIIEAGELPCYDFTVDHPNHRYWGDGFSSHNSGKSYIASGSIVKHALDKGVKVIILDSEFALDKEWVGKFYDVDEDEIDRYPVSTVDDCAKIVTVLMEQYKEAIEGAAREDYPPILIIMDSLGMLSTPSEEDQFSKGDMKGDLGRKAKQLKAFVTQCLKMFGPYPIGLVATNHTYKSQDMFNPDDVISGGSGFIYASSIVIAMQKLKLKLDDDGNKISEVRGIRSKMKCVKTRYAKPFEEVEVQIPYDKGMNPFSGLFDMFVKTGVITKSGNKWEYIDKDGEVHKHFEKEWNKRHMLLMQIMTEIDGEDIGPDNLPAQMNMTESEGDE